MTQLELLTQRAAGMGDVVASGESDGFCWVRVCTVPPTLQVSYDEEGNPFEETVADYQTIYERVKP